MAQKKDKNVKVRDLAPKKDAKGGRSTNTSASTNASLNKGVSADRFNVNRPSPSGSTGSN